MWFLGKEERSKGGWVKRKSKGRVVLEEVGRRVR